MSVLGIAVAMHAERASLSERSLEQGVVMTIDDCVLLVLAGVGPQRARLAGLQLLERGATALLSWGCAVALDPGLRPGSVVVPATVIADDASTCPVDSAWHARVCDRLQADLPIHRGALAETVEVLVDPAQKRRLADVRGAIAADMESAALGRVARERGVPFLAVRAIADDCRMRLPAWLPGTLDAVGRPRPHGLCAGLLRHPVDVLQLVGLARSFRAAMASLRHCRARTGARLLLTN